MVKKVLFSFFALFLAYQSYHLVEQLLNSENAILTVGESIAIAFLINLFVTGVFAFPGFVFPTNKFIGTAYYQINKPHRLKRIYRVLQVNLFRKLLLFFFWGRGKNRTKYFNGTRTGLINFAYQSRQSEFGHLGAFVVISLISLTLLSCGYFEVVSVCMIINVIGNFYPIILQRHHRIRIDAILKRNETK